MLKLFFERYKWYLISFLFLAYTVGVAHVATTYASAGVTADKLAEQTKLNIALQANIQLRDGFDKKLQEDLQKLQPKITTINKELQREISSHTYYSDCKSADGVRNNYDELLKTQ